MRNPYQWVVVLILICVFGLWPASSVAVPDTPTDVVATCDLTTASIAFNGTSAATYFSVTSVPGDIVTTGTSSPIVVEGLSTGSLYQFYVTAYSTTNGLSLYSDYSNAVATEYGAVTPMRSQEAGSLMIGCLWQTDMNGTSANIIPNVVGLLHRTVLSFDTTDTPTSGCDLTITDMDGIDILRGFGANLTTASLVTELFNVGGDGTTSNVVPLALFTPLSVNMTSAGAQHKWISRMYLEKP